MNDTIEVEVEKCHPDARLPHRGSAHAAGWDLHAVEASTLEPGEWGLVPTGLSVAIPEGMEMQIRPRSGTALRHGVTVLNAPGTIDADYRGEVKVLLINHGTAAHRVEPGDRIAQAIVARHAQVHYQFVEKLPDTERGDGGFGHTGVDAIDHS